MSISLIALIIALVSLIWNIISSLHSWRSSIPSIKLHTKGTWPNIEIDIFNRGGSPVLISGIKVIVRYHTNRNVLTGRYRWWENEVPESGGNMNGTSGPSLPVTLGGYHNQKWKLGEALLEEFWDQALRPPIKSVWIPKVEIQVQLGNDKVAKKKLRKSQFISKNWINRAVEPPID